MKFKKRKTSNGLMFYCTSCTFVTSSWFQIMQHLKSHKKAQQKLFK